MIQIKDRVPVHWHSLSYERKDAMADLYHKIKNLDVFADVSEVDLRNMASHFKLIHLNSREVLFEESAPIKNLYYCLYGSVKIQKQTERNRTVILNFLGRDEFLGASMAGLSNPVFPASVIAIESSAFLQFSLSFHNDVLTRIPRIRQEMARQTSERFLELQTDRCHLHRKAPQKVADFLLRILKRQMKDCRKQILFPLTRTDIALRIGTDPATVIRIFSQWTKAGVVKTTDRHIEIIDYEELEKIASL